MAHLFEVDHFHFPFNVCEELEVALQELAPHPPGTRDGVRIYQRDLDDGDDDETIGIFPTFWDPQQETVEMKGQGPVSEPTFHRYPIVVRSMVRDADEMPGRARASYLSRLIRHELYRSEHLEAVLPDLHATLGNTTEKLSKWYPEGQTYSAEQGSDFSFVTTTTFIVETEI